MLASNRRAGLVVPWCWTHATIHSLRIVSALSFRESRPGAVASGHVWMAARRAYVIKIAVRRNPVSKAPMDKTGRLCAISLLAVLSGCSAPKRPAATPVNPEVQAATRLAEADRLIRVGCLDCLIAAYGEYDQLRAFPSLRDAAASGAIRSAALAALRQREIGYVDEGYLQRARSLASSTPA